MGFFSQLFKPPAPPPKRPTEAEIVRQPGGIGVDLGWVPADHATVLAELRRVAAALHAEHVPVLVWLMPPHLLAYYVDGDEAAFTEVFDAIGHISLGRPTLMTFTEPPPDRVRGALQGRDIRAVAPERAP